MENGELEPASPARRSRARGLIVEAALTLLATVVLFVLIQAFVAQPFEVQQSSMRPTFEEGQYVLVDKLTPRFGRYARGDIVVFNPIRREICTDPDGAALPDPTPYIKRVIGEPGDTVELRDGDVYVNGAPLSEPYVGSRRTGALSADSMWTVPADRLFVLGDNREDSVDSRSDRVGLVCIADVVGRAILRYWPVDRLGFITAPAYADGQPTARASPKSSASPTPSTSPMPSPARPTPGATTTATAAAVEQLRVEVIGRRTHDPTSYTQGLELDAGRMFESSGLYGESTLREVEPSTGEVLRSVALDPRYFGEGIAVVDDRVIQLTWQEHTALVYGRNDFEQIGTFTYDTEGWGLCDDGSRLVMSDGTAQLYFRDRTTFELTGTVGVTNVGEPVLGLNELECVDGEVYANVYGTENIVRIDPSTGSVSAFIDATGLLSPEELPSEEGAVMNGIAYDDASGSFLVTGKYWPAMFEIRFVPR